MDAEQAKAGTILAPGVMRAVGLMLIATLCGAGMHAVGRHLASGLHPFEITFFRFFMGFLLMLPLVLRHRGLALKTRRPFLHLLRAASQWAAILLTFTALTLTPLATVAAMQFSWPLFGAILAVLVLGERIRARRIFALVLGFAGAMVILRPVSGALDLGALLILGSCLFFAVVAVTLKVLSRTDSSITTAFYLGLLATPIALIAALPVWQTPSLVEFAWLVLLGVIGNLANICFAQSLKEADVMVIMPIDFTKLIWATILGFVVFGELADIWTWLGGAIIFSSTLYIGYRERRTGSAAPAPREKNANG